jgi:hypothetical protein
MTMQKHTKHVLKTVVILSALFVVLSALAGCDNLLEDPKRPDTGLKQELDSQDNPGNTEKSGNADDPDNPALPTLALLRGSVATSDGNPVDEAQVSLTSGDAAYNAAVAKGEYALSDIPAGTYTFTVEMDGYKTIRQYLAVEGGDARQDAYLVTNQARTYIIDGRISVPDNGTIGGLALTLTTAEGVAVGSVNIDIADGVYWIDDVPAGDYMVQASMPGYRPASRNIKVAGDMANQDLYFDMAEILWTVGGSISGTGSVEGLSITLTGSRGQVYSAEISGDRYQISGVPEGDYTLEARLAERTFDPVSLNVSSDISNADVEILQSVQFDYTTNGASGLFASVAEASTAGQTTAINLRFDAPVLGLTAEDITLEPSEWLSVSKGSLAGGNGGKDYTLNVTVSGVESGGIKVRVEKAGYKFTPVKKVAPVYTANPLPAAPTWTLVPAGTGPGTTDVGGYLFMDVNTNERWSGGVLFNDIAYGNGRFVAVGDYQSMTSSPDGVNWMGGPLPGGATVAASQRANIQISGYDAGDGVKQRLSYPEIWTVNYLNGLFLTAIRDSAELKYSTDGLDWQGYPIGAGIFGMDYDPVGGNYVMVGHMCKVMYSNNPLSSGSWTDTKWGQATKDQVFAGGSYYVYDAANDGKGMMIAVGSGWYNINNGNDARMGISRDSGRTWTRVDLSGSSLNGSFIFKVYYRNGKWFAYGAGGRAWSVDGETWWDLPNFNGYRALSYGGGIYVTGSGGSLVYSANGAAWAPIDCGITLSPDAWHSGGSGSIAGIAYGNGRFVAVTSGGEILYSSNIQ